ncbi:MULTISPECIES: DUF1178 family protein [unclassified Sphingomonas]|uniref:DUF1178 family protein n=1 Tax=unclassified Sphingomonas TaxID=196159 RepID=UPI0006FA8D17|nr:MULTISPECIES: DUF1178 family protein [unclassified Sphingomonas]KQX18443.1 hypothetical protein ASD17_14890 [Sphingomonas sp. Root1294]KQY72231.1 hypothetical protein ASD39_20085 [Sphingomonas sp. Root50]KRB94497.1 hypothetical protein ASE22_00665 [Sphingomonas sp. Root720]
MIVFDLACRNAGHVFEIWFGSSSDYEDQKARGLVSCPYCGSTDVDKAVMAPNVAAKGNSRNDTPAASLPAAANIPPPEAFKAMIGKLAEVQAKMLEGSDYVGGDFADEARSMHLGEQESRPIHGQTSPEEARALIEEGVPVAPLLLPVRSPKSEN